MNKIPEKHVFVCINCRYSSRKSCGEEGLAIRTRLVELLNTSKARENIRINKSGCLDLCEQGPSMVIYPNKIWYKGVSQNDCTEIFERSIIKNEKIDRLILEDRDLDIK